MHRRTSCWFDPVGESSAWRRLELMERRGSLWIKADSQSFTSYTVLFFSLLTQVTFQRDLQCLENILHKAQPTSTRCFLANDIRSRYWPICWSGGVVQHSVSWMTSCHCYGQRHLSWYMSCSVAWMEPSPLTLMNQWGSSCVGGLLFSTTTVTTTIRFRSSNSALWWHIGSCVA